MALSFPSEFQVKTLEHIAAKVALSHEGDRLAVGLATGGSKVPSLQVLDVASGAIVSTHAPGVHICRDVAFGPDGDLYFLIDDMHDVKLNKLSAKDGRIDVVAAYPLTDLMDNVTCDRLGKHLAVFGRRAEVRRLAGGAVVKTLAPAEPGKDLSGCFANDGDSIYVYGTEKGQIVKIDLAADRETGRWAGPTDYGVAVAVSDGGKYIAALGQYKGLFVYDMTSGERIRPDEFKQRSVVGPPLFIHEELLVAPPAALDLSSMEDLMIPDYPSGQHPCDGGCGEGAGHRVRPSGRTSHLDPPPVARCRGGRPSSRFELGLKAIEDVFSLASLELARAETRFARRAISACHSSARLETDSFGAIASTTTLRSSSDSSAARAMTCWTAARDMRKSCSPNGLLSSRSSAFQLPAEYLSPHPPCRWRAVAMQRHPDRPVSTRHQPPPTSRAPTRTYRPRSRPAWVFWSPAS